MIVALALVIGAMLVGWLAPAPLARFSGRGNPAVALGWWLALGGAAATSTLIGAVLLLLGDRPHVDTALWQPCWAVFGHSWVHPFDELIGILLLVLCFMAAARIVSGVRSRLSASRRSHRAHLAALHTKSLSHVDGVLWLDHDAPFAYSISGKPGLVVASTALNEMPSPHRDAVLHHERHHLRHRHHWLVLAADVVGQVLTRIPLFAAAAGATRALTEYSADSGAAEHVGAEAVAAALTALGQKERSAAIRRRRIGVHRGPGRRAVHVFVVAMSSVMPVALGGAVIGLALVVSC